MTRPRVNPVTVAEFFAGVETLPEMLAKRAELTPSDAAYFVQLADGAWKAKTWSDFRSAVDALASEFAGEGITPGTRLGILASTSFGWETAQLAALGCGATVVGIDSYYPDALISELVVELGLRHLVVDDPGMLGRLSKGAKDQLVFVAFIRDGPVRSGNAATKFVRVQADARPHRPWSSLAQSTEPAIIVFSSGSVGSPRPIAYTHAQVVHACRCILDLYPELSPNTRLVCWLPLANLFQRMINFCAIAKGAVSYMVEDPRRVIEVLPVANPEVFVAVPRFCEKLYAGMMRKVSSHRRVSRAMEGAISLGAQLRGAEAGRSRVSQPKRMAARFVDSLVLSRFRAVMGTNLRYIVTGSAPMPRWLLDRFSGLGIPILEAYGASENLVPIAANRWAAHKAGTVGKPVGDNDVRIARDGEVQVRGNGVFQPTLGENAARAGALTQDGYLATGDLGAFDEDGFLVLRGRRGDVFKNAQGRWVSLPEIEAALRRLPEVEHAAVIRMADERLIGILSLVLPQSTIGDVSDIRAAERRVSAKLHQELKRKLALLPPAMRPVAFLIVCRGFSPSTGELTSNLKLRRDAIAEKLTEPLRALSQEISRQASGMSEPITLKFV